MSKSVGFFKEACLRATHRQASPTLAHTDGMSADLVQKLAKPTVIVIGDFILDRYVWGKVNRISPEAPIQILSVQKEDDRLGGAANVVNNLIALDANVIALGVSGADAASKKILSIFDEISAACGKKRFNYKMVFDRKHNTPIKERMIAHNQQMLRVDKEAQDEDYSIASATEQKLIRHLAQNIKKADVVIVSDYDKGVLTKTLLQKAIALCRRHKKIILVGPKGKDFRKYYGATAIVPNRSETEEAIGIDISDDGHSYRQAARKMLRNFGLDFVVITLGPKGLYLMDKKGCVASDPARHRDVYDVTGAGDTVLATLGIALASRLSYQQVLHLANLSAGVVVSKVGTATVSRDEIIQHHYLLPAHENIKAEHKLRTVRQLTKILESKKSEGRKIVFTNGCFDLIHPGHVRTLEFARSQGDILVLGLNSDKSVKRIKGKGRPILNQAERAKVLSAFSSVDYIVIFNESTPLEVIKKLQPDILVKGADWAENNIVGSDVLKKYGGRIVRVPLIPETSTSAIIKRIRHS